MENPFRYCNSSPEFIRLTVMMYVWYPLSLRQVEDLLFERGIDICHETVRINGETNYLWRAADDEGEVLEVFATKRRNRRAALKFLKRAMRRYGQPKVIVTDRLRSYRAAMNVIENAGRQETGRRPNGRAENSHQPFWRRERGMAKFKIAKSLQKFVLIHASVHNHFNQERLLRCC